MRIRTTTLAICSALILSVVGTTDAWALRCGSALIDKGDSKAKVLKHCGQPVDKTYRYGVRPGFYTSGSSVSTIDGGRLYVYGRNEVLVEEWTFNFGPRKLMRLIRFADGVVEEVKTLSYGYR